MATPKSKIANYNKHGRLGAPNAHSYKRLNPYEKII
jgi:hypothetical protein